MATKNSEANLFLERKKRRRDIKHYIVSFVMMIALTFLSFIAVIYRDGINDYLIAFFIVTLAVVQVLFQLYYFMHLKDKDHQFPAFFIFSGAFVAFTIILTFVSIIWLS